MNMSKSLEQKVAIVTGSGAGIGLASALNLSRKGVKILTVDINDETANKSSERICKEGGDAIPFVGDVAKEKVAKKMVEQAMNHFGRLDILVQNAFGAPDGAYGSAVEITIDGYRKSMAVLVDALFFGARFAVPAMQSSGPPPTYEPIHHAGNDLSNSKPAPQEIGRIVNISSVHGLLQAAKMLTYETGKAAVVGLTRQMAIDFGPAGITVNAIAPGHIVTEAGEKSWQTHGNAEGFRLFELQYPVRRTGIPDDIAHAVSFLCSSEASFINGVLLPIDGGLSIQLQENIVMEVADYVRNNPDLRSHFDLDANNQRR